jgi:hypothetical protein
MSGVTRFFESPNGKDVPVSYEKPMPVSPTNLVTKFRDAFETLSADNWTTTLATGDLVQVDGNAAGAAYLSISKSPWDAGTETVLETVPTFDMPIELVVGAHRSQATLGQEFSLELVDTDTPRNPTGNIAISSITQSTTTLTVDTVDDHGLVPGKCIGIVGCSNQRANYPSLVVATIPTPRQFTATAGPGGTITSQTITNPSGDKGVVYIRERLGLANDGVSQIFENATATNASFYIRSDSNDSLPSGTVTGNQTITVGSTASVQLVNAPYTFAFSPTTEYRLIPQADRVQASDVAVDSLSQSNSRVIRTQLCPDPAKKYKFRVRATNNAALTVLTCKIISAAKTGGTTATFSTLTPHGLTTGDLIVYYGNSNTGASAFPNVTTPTAVTVTGFNAFTMDIGTAATVTGWGGVIAKVQGGNALSALGVVNNSAVSAVLTSLTNGEKQLVLTGASSWSGLSIGDYVNVEGVTNVVDGTTLGVDGAWKVANSVTTALTLVPCNAEFATTLPVFGATTCGGAVIKRSCLRLSYVRVFDFSPQRVEMLSRPSGDIASGAPVVIQNAPSITTAGTPAAPATPLTINSAATTNGQLVQSGTSGLQALFASNTGAGAAYVKLYNKATAPTVGTDTPAMLITVPAAVAGVPGSVEITPGFSGYRFALGLGLAITGGAADSDTTAVAAGQVKVILSRTA